MTGPHIFGQTPDKHITLKINARNSIDSLVLKTIEYQTKFKENQEVLKELESLKNELQRLGHLDNTYNLVKTNDSLFSATFRLQKHYPIIYLKIQKNKNVQDYISQTGLVIRNDSIKIETAFAKAYLKKLSAIASNNGNPFAKFQITNITKDTNQNLKADLKYLPGTKRTINNINIQGYTNAPKNFLKYSVGIKEGAVFNRKELNEQSNRLSNLPFIHQTKPPEVLFTTDSTTIYLYLERRTTNKFDGFLGFSSEDNNNLRLNGYLDLTLVNNFNYGESFVLNYKADGGDQSQLSIYTQLPYLFKTPLGIEASLNLFRKDSTFSTTKQTLNLLYQRNQRNSYSIGYETEQSENLSTNTQTQLRDYTTTRLRASFKHEQLSSQLFFPLKRRLYLQASAGNRQVANEKERQISLTAIIENEFDLYNKHSLYLKNTSNYLLSNNLLTNELFRFGGILSMRGFEENSILANFFNTLNSEYRYKLTNNLYINSILDFGYFENDVNNTKQKLYSFGLGTGVQTKTGILKLNLANGIFENDDFRFSNIKLHVILEVRF